MTSRTVTNCDPSATLQALEKERERTRWLMDKLAEQTYIRSKAREADQWQAQYMEQAKANKALQNRYDCLKAALVEIAARNAGRKLAEHALFMAEAYEGDPVLFQATLSLYVRNAERTFPAPDGKPSPVQFDAENAVVADSQNPQAPTTTDRGLETGGNRESHP